jgi:hypothetical protein
LLDVLDVGTAKGDFSKGQMASPGDVSLTAGHSSPNFGQEQLSK